MKQKNGNVKCKVRVMHRGDSSGSSSSAVSTFYISKNVNNLYHPPLLDDWFRDKAVYYFAELGPTIPASVGFIHMLEMLILLQPIAAENLGRWGNTFASHDFFTWFLPISHVVWSISL